MSNLWMCIRKSLVAAVTTQILASCTSIFQIPAAPAIVQDQAAPKTGLDGHGQLIRSIDKDGVHVVAIDIRNIGDYRNAGGTMCHWARLHSLNPADVIEANTSSSPQVVRINFSDIAFLTENCGTWEMVLP